MGWITDLLQELPLSAIQRERLALAEQKYALLERKHADLEAENNSLKIDNSNLRQEIQRSTDVIQKQMPHGQDLEEIREKLLVALSAGENLQVGQLAQAVGIGEQLATFHLNEMKVVHLVSTVSFNTGRPTIWRIAQEGRGYLANHGLLT